MALLNPNPPGLEAIRQTLAEAEQRMLATVAKRLARGIDQPGWAEAKLAEVQALDRQIKSQFNDAVQGISVAVGDTLTDAGGLRGTLATSANVKATEALVDETLTRVRSTQFRILRGHQDIFRQAVAKASAIQTTGSTTTRQAAQEVMAQLSRSGVTAFVDTKGRHWKLGTYADMAVRTATGRAQVGARVNEYVAQGRNLVIVSNSPDECPRCRKWEGKVLAVDPSKLTSSELYEVNGTLKEATSAGLFHPNCAHDLRPFIPGLTKRDPEVGFPTAEDASRVRRKAAAAEKRKAAAAARAKAQEAARQDAATEPFGDTPLQRQIKAKKAAQERIARELTEKAPKPEAARLSRRQPLPALGERKVTWSKARKGNGRLVTEMSDAEKAAHNEAWTRDLPDAPSSVAQRILVRRKYVVEDRQTIAMNQALREGKVTQRARQIDQIIDTSELTEDSILHRGLAVTKEQADRFEPGATITDPGFQSADKSIGTAEFYARERLADNPGTEIMMMEIRAQAGRRAADVGFGEVVLPRGTTMRVVSKRKDSQGIWRLVMEVIDSE